MSRGDKSYDFFATMIGNDWAMLTFLYDSEPHGNLTVFNPFTVSTLSCSASVLKWELVIDWSLITINIHL